MASLIAGYMYDVWSYAGDLQRVVFQRSTGFGSVFQDLEAQGINRLALVVPHPTMILEFSMRHLIEALLANEYAVIFAVGSEDAAEWVKQDFPDVRVVVRGSGGRDFGVWRELILALCKNQRIMSGLERLLLANDSLYFNAHTKQLIKGITEFSTHWSCIYESFEPCHHAQSFVLAFDRVAINQKAFIDYWRSYIPFGNRRHVIKNGELRLSRKFIPILGVPSCLLNSKTIYDGVQRLDVSEVGALLQMVRSNNQIKSSHAAALEQLDNIILSDGGAALQHEASRSRINQLISSILIKSCELQNPTHTVGLIANHLFNTPLKRDLSYRGTHQIADILRFAVGYSETELQLIRDDLRSKALPVSIRGFRRLLFLAGRI